MSNIENEQMYLDMVGQLKDKYDEITSQLESIERSGKEIKKDFITVYGVVIMVEVLRGFLSDCVDKYIL